MWCYFISIVAILYLKLGMDFPLDSLISSKSPCPRLAPEFGSSIVADMHLIESLPGTLLAFRNLSSAEVRRLSIEMVYKKIIKDVFYKFLYIYIYICFPRFEESHQMVKYTIMYLPSRAFFQHICFYVL